MKLFFRFGTVAAVAAAVFAGTATASAATTSTARVRPAMPPGYTVVVTRNVAAPNGRQSEGYVLCPTGTVVLGGGEDLAGGPAPPSTARGPEARPAGTRRYNSTGSATTFDV